jgi:hypothetical protein
MLRFETLLWDEGHDAVAGVDETGMSPLAGPVAAAAVILKPGTRITGIDDSKKLDANSREALAKEIKEKAASWSVAFVEVEEIDTINIYWAGILAMRRAVEGLGHCTAAALASAPTSAQFNGCSYGFCVVAGPAAGGGGGAFSLTYGSAASASSGTIVNYGTLTYGSGCTRVVAANL